MAAMGRVSLFVAGLVAAAVPYKSSLGPRPGLPAPYLEAVLAYRRGDIDNAVDRLGAWRPEALKRAATAAADGADDWRLRASAAMLHVEVILHGKATTDAPVSLHMALAERIIDKLDSADFRRRWYSLAGSVYLARTDPTGASTYIDRGQRLFKDDARLHMLAGAVNELRSHLADSNLHDRVTVRITPPGGRRALVLAESSYRRALDLDSTLDEARLRLGRVISLRNDQKAARMELERVARHAEIPRLQYLAHLFLGAVAEYQNDFATARADYRAALAIGPACQTPYIALSSVDAALGHDVTARDLMARYAAVSAEAAPDPWWFYQNGGIDEESLVWLRQQAWQ
jgi:tetratricopeptide (TPR) repeat protein